MGKSTYEVPSQQMDEQFADELPTKNDDLYNGNDVWHDFLHMYGTVTKLAKPKGAEGRKILRESFSSMREQLTELYKPKVSENGTTSMPALITTKKNHNRKRPASSPEKNSSGKQHR